MLWRPGDPIQRWSKNIKNPSSSTTLKWWDVSPERSQPRKNPCRSTVPDCVGTAKDQSQEGCCPLAKEKESHWGKDRREDVGIENPTRTTSHGKVREVLFPRKWIEEPGRRVGWEKHLQHNRIFIIVLRSVRGFLGVVTPRSHTLVGS